MEKQLVDILNNAKDFSDIDEVSQAMIASRAKVFFINIHDLVDKFVNDFQKITDSDKELCNYLGITCLFAYSDNLCKGVAKEEGNSDKAIKSKMILGTRLDAMFLHSSLASDIYDVQESDRRIKS